MEELLAKYKEAINSGETSDLTNDSFCMNFIDEITHLSPDIRDGVYREFLRDLLIFEFQLWQNHANDHAQSETSNDNAFFLKCYYLHSTIIGVVCVLNQKGIILSKHSFESIDKQFKSENARIRVDNVKELLEEYWNDSLHITDALISFMIGYDENEKKDHAQQFLNEAENIKNRTPKKMKSLIFEIFSKHAIYANNDHTNIANTLKECLYINYTKGDIQQYVKAKKRI